MAQAGVKDSRQAITDYQLQSSHLGKWRRREYRLGRHVAGGYWQCCGIQDRYCLECTEEGRQRWHNKQTECEKEEATIAARRALAQERRREWEKEKADRSSAKCEAVAQISFTDERRRSSVAVRMPGKRSAENYTFSDSGKIFKEHNVPMLIQAFQEGGEWEVGESLAAAMTMLNEETGRKALLRHGMVFAIKQRLLSAVMYHESKQGKEPLSPCRLAMCLKIVKALATCPASRTTLVDDRELGLLALHRMAQFKNFDEALDLMHIIFTTTESRPTQKAFLNNSAVPFQGVVLPRLQPHPVHILSQTVHENLFALKNPAKCSQESHFILARLALQTIEHIAQRGASSRDHLRTKFGIIRLCLDSIALIRKYMDTHKAAGPTIDAASAALSVAVALLCQLAVNRNSSRIDPLVLDYMREIYDTIRSQLSRADIQIQGLHLLCTLAQTDDGARELDKIKGSWQWLGRIQMKSNPDGGPFDWCCTDDPRYTPSKNFEVHTDTSWNATRLALFLGMRIPSQENTQLDSALSQLHDLALLPFETENAQAWQRRVREFERRNNLQLLDKLRMNNNFY